MYRNEGLYFDRIKFNCMTNAFNRKLLWEKKNPLYISFSSPPTPPSFQCKFIVQTNCLHVTFVSGSINIWKKWVLTNPIYSGRKSGICMQKICRSHSRYFHVIVTRTITVKIWGRIRFFTEQHLLLKMSSWPG
jgi:hypothetical protein